MRTNYRADGCKTGSCEGPQLVGASPLILGPAAAGRPERHVVVTVASKDADAVLPVPCGGASGNGLGRSAMKDYLVIYEQGEDGGWGAHSPDIEGVFALGQTREEVEARMAEALTAHLSMLRERGERIPEPRTDAGRVAA
jgi:predicted RNase H-like HicB family nuclease